MPGLVHALSTGLSVIGEIILISRDVSKAQIIIQGLTAGNWIDQTLDPCIISK